MLTSLHSPGESLQVSSSCLQALGTYDSLSCLSKVTWLVFSYSGFVFHLSKNYVMDQGRTVVTVGAVLCQYYKGEQWPTAPVDLLVSWIILYQKLLFKLSNP